MKRISTNMPNMDMLYHMRIREWKMNELQNKMASQTRIKELRARHDMTQEDLAKAVGGEDLT